MDVGSKIVVSARPAKGYWGYGRYWSTQPCELEVVAEPTEEKILDGDTFEQRQTKAKLREKRIAENHVTSVEVERIIADQHLAEAVIPSSAKLAEMEKQLAAANARIADLEAQLGKKSKAV